MARSYALSGDNKQAVVYAKKALPQAPDDANRKNIEGLIQQWSAPAPAEAALCARAAEARSELHAALIEARADYIGEDPHSSESRLNRFLKRLSEEN